MLKYIAFIKEDKPERWHNWHSGSTCTFFKSPLLNEKQEAEEWLKKGLKKYPKLKSRINENMADKEYYIKTYIIAFDDIESFNIEEFFERI